LRSVVNSSDVKATIFIPLVGYLVLFNDHIVTYVNLWNSLFDKGDTNVSLRLLCLYFGLCFLAVASVLYSLFCPREVKAYGSAAQFIGTEGENLSVHELCETSNLLKKNGQSDPDFEDYCSGFVDRKKIAGLDDHRLKNVEVETKGLSRYYKFQNLRYPALRVVVAALFIGGFILLLIPSAMIFWRALQLLFALLT
jgi:hypothetical protein